MKILTGKPGIETAEDLSNDEVDAQLILEYLEAKMRGGGKDYGPPESAWLNGTKAHENLAAWKLIENKLPNHMTELDAMKIIKRFNPFHVLKGEHGGEFTSRPGGTPISNKATGKHWSLDLPKDLDAGLQPVVKQEVERLASRYTVPIPKLTITPQGGSFAQTMSDTGDIALSRDHWRKGYAEWLKMGLQEAHDVRKIRGPIDPETGKQTKMQARFLVGSEPKDTITHEYAHVLTTQYEKDDPRGFALLIKGIGTMAGVTYGTPDVEKVKKFVTENSAYAATSEIEAIAEGFNEYERGVHTELSDLVGYAFGRYRPGGGA